MSQYEIGPEADLRQFGLCVVLAVVEVSLRLVVLRVVRRELQEVVQRRSYTQIEKSTRILSPAIAKRGNLTRRSHAARKKKAVPCK